MAVGAQPVQPDDRGIWLRRGFDFDGFQQSELMYSETLCGDQPDSRERALEDRYIRRWPIALDHLRRYAIARSLFKPTTLTRAIEKLGFVQADPDPRARPGHRI